MKPPKNHLLVDISVLETRHFGLGSGTSGLAEATDLTGPPRPVLLTPVGSMRTAKQPEDGWWDSHQAAT